MKKKLALITIILFSIMLMSCKKVATTVTYSPSEELNYGVYSIPSSLVESSKGINDEILSALFDGLIYKDNDGSIKPQLSESYTVDKNQLEYTFKLRRDIYWSNGEKITSRDFVDFFKEIIDNSKDIDEINELKSVYGVTEYFNKKENFKDVVAISADGEFLKVRLNYKDDKFLDNMTKNKFKIKKDFAKLSSYKNSYKDIIYSGAYKISNINENGDLTLEKNTKYYEDINGKEKVNIILYNNNEAALASYETNKVNIIKDPPLNYLSNLLDREEVIQGPSYKDTFISFNSSKNSVFNNAKLRKDFGMYIKGIISMEEFKKNIPSNLINDFYSINKENSNSIKRIEPASSLMELKSITIVALNNEYNKEVLKFITEESKKDNLIIYYRLLTEEDLNEEVEKGKFTVFLGELEGFTDYNQIYNNIISKIYKDEELNSKIKSLDKNISKENIIKDIMKDSYCIPLYNSDSIIVKKRNIEEISKDFYGNLILSDIVVAEEITTDD